MSDIIFCRTRHNYDSYQDFWRLVELSHYPTIYVDEIEPDSDHCYIYSPNNGETINGWPGAKARIVWYQLEWETHPNDTGPLPDGVAEKWTMDAGHAQRIGAKYVPIGSHPQLAGDKLYHQLDHYDTALMAYLGPPRRSTLLHELWRRNLTVAPNGWGNRRDFLLRSSRSMLHVHQHADIRGVAALRVALAAAYSLPYFSEQVDDPGVYPEGSILYADYQYLVDFAHNWLTDERNQMMIDYGRNLHRFLCVEKPFRYWIEAAV